MFGSDYPFAPATATAMQIKELEQSQVLDDAWRGSIERTNALALLPHLGAPATTLAPPVSGLGDALAKPIVAIAVYIRNR